MENKLTKEDSQSDNFKDEQQFERSLLEYAPGGVAIYRVKKDGRISTDYISDGLAKVCGYDDSEDIMKVIGEDSRKLVLEEDFPIVQKACKDSLEKGIPTSVQYRVHGKNGKPVRITLDSIVMKDIKLGEDDVAVFYAVQTIVSNESQKRIEENEIRERVMNHVPSGIGIYDVYDHVAHLSYLNPSYLEMMGLKAMDRAQYYGKDISALIHPDDRKTVQRMIDDVYNGERKSSILIRVRNGEDNWKWIRFSSKVVPQSNKRYTIYASLFDYDFVVENEKEKKASRRKEETLLSSIPGGIAIYHIKKNGKVATEYVSEGLARMCGYTTEEFLAYLKEDALVNLVPEDLPFVTTALEKSIKENKTLSTMYHIYQKDGTPIFIRLDANRINTEEEAEDELAIYYGVHVPVSEESRHIIEDQKYLSVLLNSVPAGIGVFEMHDDVLELVYMNDSFFDILHTTREERKKFYGRNALKTVHPDDLARIKKELQKLIDGESSIQIDYRHTDSMGKYVWFHVTASVTVRRKHFIRFLSVFSDYTENKEQEILLMQNNHAVDLAQKRGHICIWMYNIDRKRITQHVEDSDKSAMGYNTVLENVPQCFIENNSIYPDDQKQFLKAYQDLDEGKQFVEVTYRLLNHETHKFEWIHMFYQRMKMIDDSDRIAAGFSMNVDKQQEAIERYNIEHALRERMNGNALIYMEYNLSKDCFENDIQFTDAYRKEDWKDTKLETYLSSLQKTVDPRYIDELMNKMYAKNLLKEYENGEQKVTVEFQGKEDNDHPYLWYRVSAALVKRPDTNDVMAFITVENIEDKKNRQKAMELSLNDGVESVTIIHLSDRKAEIIQAHNNYIPFGMSKSFIYDDAFVQKSHSIVSSGHEKHGADAATLKVIQQELQKADVYQYTVSTKHGSDNEKRELFRFRYLDDRKTCVVMSISDITSVYLEEQEKKKELENALQIAQFASQSKADFYSRMSHDMRTPMNGILGMAHLSEDETDVQTLKANIQKIKDSGEYLLSLINDTLDIQRIESGKMKLEPKIVNITDVVRNILEMVRISASDKGVILDFDHGNTDLNWFIRADALRLKQIFVNLLSNAIKFTPKGGTVSFHFRLLKREGMVSHDVIYVQDTGIGMSEDFLKNGIFKPFSQETNAVSGKYAGSGLGLSIAKSLVELMGGKIEVESTLGKGTTFAVYLDFERVNPEEAQEYIQHEKIQTQDVSAQLKGMRILLAEDHPLNAEIAQKLLKKQGCIVTWVEDGREAVETMQNSINQFDVILMDIRMPVMDGLEATKKIRKIQREDTKNIPIVAMSANAYEEDVKKSLDVGMNGHIAKPIDVKVLYDTLATFVRK